MKRYFLVGCCAIAFWAGPCPAGAEEAAIAGKAVFQSQCSICHSVQSGRNLVGPSLFGIVGRQAGQVPGFHYSSGNKDSKVTWEAATLDHYLASPRDVVPGTTMNYGGLKDPQKRAALVAYLSTLH